MIGIVIVAHGGLAHEYKKTMQHVVGEQAGIGTVRISEEFDKPAKQAEICSAMTDVDDGDGVVLVTDLYGSSPSNLCMAACVHDNMETHVLYGANMPMLLQLARKRHLPIKEAVAAAVKAGRKHLDYIHPSS
ncbi:MAG: PTS sugar transporter subunit IIA [Planktomarina sp.]